MVKEIRSSQQRYTPLSTYALNAICPCEGIVFRMKGSFLFSSTLGIYFASRPAQRLEAEISGPEGGHVGLGTDSFSRPLLPGWVLSILRALRALAQPLDVVLSHPTFHPTLLSFALNICSSKRAVWR